jgi:hypothetical protein
MVPINGGLPAWHWDKPAQIIATDGGNQDTSNEGKAA